MSLVSFKLNKKTFYAFIVVNTVKNWSRHLKKIDLATPRNEQGKRKGAALS